MPIYKKFATVYDTMLADQHSIKMTVYSMKIFKKFKIKPKIGLDLCCGTGTAIYIFSEIGIKMSGLDQSAEMLVVAKKKNKKYAPNLYCQSLPKFTIPSEENKAKPEQFDLITSFYDSLNYMTTETKLRATFGSVARHLKKDGWFVFDMNTPEALKTIWDEQTYSGVKDTMAWIWRNEYDKKKKLAACHATFFKKKGKLWERFDETHYERGYNNSTIKKLLKDSGFTIKGFYTCHTFQKPDKDSYRICVVAQKV